MVDPLVVTLFTLLTVMTLLFFMLLYRYEELKANVRLEAYEEAKKIAAEMVREWEEKRAAEIRAAVEAECRARFREWAARKEREFARREKMIRLDAVKRSAASILGMVSEQLAPLILADALDASPKDFRHIGSPVDYVVFRGLSRGAPEEIVFLEVKHAKSPRLSASERAVKRLVEECRVSWMVVNIRDIVNNAIERLEKGDGEG